MEDRLWDTKMKWRVCTCTNPQNNINKVIHEWHEWAGGLDVYKFIWTSKRGVTDTLTNNKKFRGKHNVKYYNFGSKT